jgi:hypothetical protein
MQDRLENTQPLVRGSLVPNDFSGTWLNTNTETPGIVRVEFDQDEKSGLRVRLFGNGDSEPRDWGEAAAGPLCAASIQGGAGMSFVCEFDLGFKRAEVGMNLNQGLLVIALYHSFQSSGSANYFSREFFRRAGQA